MRGNDGTHYLNVNNRAKLWKVHMPKSMNEENKWDKVDDADSVEGPMERMTREKTMEAIKHLKNG